jgi:hypothetical protein
MSLPDAIPAAKRDAVQAALRDVFGAKPAQAITPISGGASGALLFRTEVSGRDCLLRVEGPPSPLRNPHQYISTRIASDAGLTPRLFYVDEAHGIAITDFVRERPLSSYPGGKPALVQALGGLLRKVQETPVFPVFVEYPDIVARLFAYVCSTGLFAHGLLDRHTEHLEALRAAHRWDMDKTVSAHNDLNARNILFDGERLWLIDWESAYRNDPLVDLAVLFDNLAPTPDLEDVLVQAWQGRALDEAQCHRLSYIRALTRLYYAGVLLSASTTMPRDAPDDDLSVPVLADFAAALRDGTIKPRTPESIHTAGKMYLAAFLGGGAVPPLDVL